MGCGGGSGPSNSDATIGRTGSGGTARAPTAPRCLPPLGGDETGSDPTNRGKLGTKRHLLSDRRGAPLSLVLSAANRTDMKLAEATLDGLVVDRPPPTASHPQHLSRDKGFDYPATDQAAAARGYTLHTARKRRRADPTPPPLSDTESPPWRWTSERTNSWHNRCRTLRSRYEKHAANYRGLVEFACSLIVYRLCSFLG